VALQQPTIAADTGGHRVTVDQVCAAARGVLAVVANPTVSNNNRWPVGFWAAELTHPYSELTQHGIEVTIPPHPTAGRSNSTAYPIPAPHHAGRQRT